MVTNFGGTLLPRLSPQKQWSKLITFPTNVTGLSPTRGKEARALLVLFPVLTNSNRGEGGGVRFWTVSLWPCSFAVLVRVTRYHSDGPNFTSRVHVPWKLLLLVMASVLGPQFNVCTRPPAIASFPCRLSPPLPFLRREPGDEASHQQGNRNTWKTWWCNVMNHGASVNQMWQGPFL